MITDSNDTLMMTIIISYKNVCDNLIDNYVTKCFDVCYKSNIVKSNQTI